MWWLVCGGRKTGRQMQWLGVWKKNRECCMVICYCHAVSEWCGERFACQTHNKRIPQQRTHNTQETHHTTHNKHTTQLRTHNTQQTTNTSHNRHTPQQTTDTPHNRHTPQETTDTHQRRRPRYGLHSACLLPSVPVAHAVFHIPVMVCENGGSNNARHSQQGQ